MVHRGPNDGSGAHARRQRHRILDPHRRAFARDIAVDPDGALWFTGQSGDKVGRIATAGEVTKFRWPGTLPGAIAAGPDGAL